MKNASLRQRSFFLSFYWKAEKFCYHFHSQHKSYKLFNLFIHPPQSRRWWCWSEMIPCLVILPVYLFQQKEGQQGVLVCYFICAHCLQRDASKHFNVHQPLNPDTEGWADEEWGELRKTSKNIMMRRESPPHPSSQLRLHTCYDKYIKICYNC